MEIKEAIDILLDTDLTCYGYSKKEVDEAGNMGAEALEKQIPKKPKAERVYLYAEHFEEWLECPECGEVIPDISDNETECYCAGCGQKLSWD